MSRERPAGQDGVALLMALAVMTLAVAMLSSMASQTFSHMLQARLFTEFKDCFHGLECAISEGMAELEQGKDGCIGVEAWREGVATSGEALRRAPLSFGSAGIEPVRIAPMNKVEYFVLALDWSADGLDNSGDGVPDDPNEQGMYTIYAFARCSSVTRAAEVVLRRGQQGLTQVSWREVLPPITLPRVETEKN